MPIVTFYPSKKTVEVEQGETLYEAAEQANIPLASSCSANFVCGKCNVQIVEGRENCSPQRESEVTLLEREGHNTSDRIGCQTRVLGDCTVTTHYW